jgi:hypothetical protein
MGNDFDHFSDTGLGKSQKMSTFVADCSFESIPTDKTDSQL